MPVDINGILSALGQFQAANKTDAERIMQAQANRGGMLSAVGTVGGGVLGGMFGGPLGAAAGAGLGSVVGHTLAGGGAGMQGAGQDAINGALNAYSMANQIQQQKAQGELAKPGTPGTPGTPATPGTMPSAGTPNLTVGALGTVQTIPNSGTPATAGTPGTPAIPGTPGTPGGVLSKYFTPFQLSKMSPQMVQGLLSMAKPEIVQTAPGATTSAVSPLALMQSGVQGGDQGNGAAQVIQQGKLAHVATDEEKTALKLDSSRDYVIHPDNSVTSLPGGTEYDRMLKEYRKLETANLQGQPFDHARHEALGQRLAQGMQQKDENGNIYTIPKLDLGQFRAAVQADLKGGANTATANPANTVTPTPKPPAMLTTGAVTTKMTADEEKSLKQHLDVAETLKRMDSTVGATGRIRGSAMWQGARNFVGMPDAKVQQFNTDAAKLAPMMHDVVSRVAGYDFNIAQLGGAFPRADVPPDVNRYRIQQMAETLKNFYKVDIENLNARHVPIPASIREGARTWGLDPGKIGAVDHGGDVKLGGSAEVPIRLTPEALQDVKDNPKVHAGKFFEYNGTVFQAP